jgi:hypothetical protein
MARKNTTPPIIELELILETIHEATKKHVQGSLEDDIINI